MRHSPRTAPLRALAAYVTVLAAAAVAAVLPGSAAADGSLTGTVGPGFTISLIDSAGKPVEHLAAGTYTIAVRDRSEFHNFHLLGAGGVSKFTDVEGKSEEMWTVTLVDGKYSVLCDPHGAAMEQDFTVGTVATEPAAAPAATAAPAAKPAATTKAPLPVKASAAAKAAVARAAATKAAAAKAAAAKAAAKKAAAKTK